MQAVKAAVVILRRKQVQAITGLSRSSIYAMMKAGDFPKSVKLSARSVGWVENQVTGFLEGRIAASNGTVKEAA
jgi:prophage regulatory protein